MAGDHTTVALKRLIDASNGRVRTAAEGRIRLVGTSSGERLNFRRRYALPLSIAVGPTVRRGIEDG